MTPSENNLKIPNVVYITSAGHSGSTLLDFLIGSIPDTFSTGELVHFPWQLYRSIQSRPSIKGQNICTCGKSFFDCEVWGKIIKLIYQNENVDMRKNPFHFDISIQRSKTYEGNKKIFNKGIRNMFFLSSNHRINRTIKNIYYYHYQSSILNNWKLFQYLKKTTNTRYIIDSTKDPIRFQMLHKMHTDKIKLIILVRDVFGVATSGIIRQEHNNIQKAAKGWLKFYNKKVLDILKTEKDLDYLILHYSEIAKYPEKTIKIIAKFLDISNFQFKNDFTTKDYHLIAGNPMRYKDNFTIIYDEKWKNYINNEQYTVLKYYQNQLNPIFTKLSMNN